MAVHRSRGALPQRPMALLLALLLALITGLLPVALTAAHAQSAAVPAAVAPGRAILEIRQVPGPSPQQTIQRFLDLTQRAELTLRQALREGLAAPGPAFPSTVAARVNGAIDALQQATQALDLSRVPPALRPMTGVATMLQLRSLLLYEMAQSPGLVIPDRAEAERQHLRRWSIPDTSITLSAIGDGPSPAAWGCEQCNPGDFLFSSETLARVPERFSRVFDGDPALRRQYGADLYTYWALLPGGAIPPKWFFLLPRGWRSLLLTQVAGQSWLQWLLLLPITAMALLLMAWWLLRLRRWHRLVAERPGPWPHLVGVLAVVPLLGLVWAWQWFAIDWINLIGPREQAVLVGGRLLRGLLQALLLYLLAETIGQLVAVRRRRDATGKTLLQRRKGSGQILTVARLLGVVAVVVVLIHTGRDLGLTSLTLLALSSVPALAISLGTQQLIRDVADGFSLLLDGQVKVGDLCTIGSGFTVGTVVSEDIHGRIQVLGMRSARLELEDGSVLTIPNSQLASSMVTNHRFRSGHPLAIALPLPGHLPDPDLARQRLEHVRELLAQVPELRDGRVELEPSGEGWRLQVSGQWGADLTDEALSALRESLQLKLLELMRQAGR